MNSKQFAEKHEKLW